MAYGDGGFYFLQPVGSGQGYAGIQFGAAGPLVGAGAGKLAGGAGGAKKTDFMPPALDATEKSVKDPSKVFTAYKQIVVVRRPNYLASVADRDAWLVYLANKLTQVADNRAKDARSLKSKKDELAAKKDEYHTSDKDKKIIADLEAAISTLNAKVAAHDIRKEWYSSSTYIRDLWDRISKASTPAEKEQAAQAAITVQSTKDKAGGVVAPTAEEAAVANAAAPETAEAGGTSVAPTETVTPTEPAQPVSNDNAAAAAAAAAASAEEPFYKNKYVIAGAAALALGFIGWKLSKD